MVIGFDRFREAFQDFAENYIVIGGSACDWLFTSRNAQFRATKDIDLVLVAERMSPAFATMIWEFVRAGGYSAYERKDGKKCFYRFLNPTAADYPFMLEFFAREPIGFPIDKKTVIVPIPVDDEDISSLSGILMDENYYSFIRSHRIEVEGVSILPAEALLLLKARAWFDLSMRKARGEFVKDKDVRKHRTDILRLQAQIVELKIEVFEIEKKVLEPKGRALADGRRLRRLEMGEGERLDGLILFREIIQAFHAGQKQFADAQKPFFHNDEVGIVADVAGGRAEVDNGLRRRADVAALHAADETIPLAKIHLGLAKRKQRGGRHEAAAGAFRRAGKLPEGIRAESSRPLRLLARRAHLQCEPRRTRRETPGVFRGVFGKCAASARRSTTFLAAAGGFPFRCRRFAPGRNNAFDTCPCAHYCNIIP